MTLLLLQVELPTTPQPTRVAFCETYEKVHELMKEVEGLASTHRYIVSCLIFSLFTSSFRQYIYLNNSLGKKNNQVHKMRLRITCAYSNSVMWTRQMTTNNNTR